jgi:hypothetical protein
MAKLIIEGVRKFNADNLTVEGATTEEVKDILREVGLGELHIAGDDKKPAAAAAPKAEDKKDKKDKKPTGRGRGKKTEEKTAESKASNGANGKAAAAPKPAPAPASEPEPEPEPEAAPEPEPEAESAEPGEHAVLVEALQEAKRLRDVVVIARDCGYDDIEDIASVCDSVKGEVPLLQRVKDVPTRLKTAHDMLEQASA